MQCNVMSNSIINNQQQFDLFVSKFASKHEKPLWYCHKQFYGIVIPIVVMKVNFAQNWRDTGTCKCRITPCPSKILKYKFQMVGKQDSTFHIYSICSAVMLHFGLPYELLSREGTLRNSALTWKEAAILSLMWFSSSRKKCERSLARTKENAAIISWL